MQLDALLANMDDFDYICDESVDWVNDNIIGKGYTTTTVIQRMNTDPLIPENERRVWIRNARRMFSEPTAIWLGGEAIDTDVYRLLVNRIVVKESSLEDCRQYKNNMGWVRFSNVTDGVISLGNIDAFDLAETDMGDTYTSKADVLSLFVTLERKIIDLSETTVVWEEV